MSEATYVVKHNLTQWVREAVAEAEKVWPGIPLKAEIDVDSDLQLVIIVSVDDSGVELRRRSESRKPVKH